MKVILAEYCGFCFGVTRALQIAEDTRNSTGEIWTDGPLIHNEQEVTRLEKCGIHQLRDDDEMNGKKTILLRAHGVTKVRVNDLKKRGFTLVDATCPRVRRAQEIIAKYTSIGYTGIVIGDKEHAEIRSILGHSEGNCLVVPDQEAAQKVDESLAPFAVISQTTYNVFEIKKIIKLLPLNPERDKIIETICNATQRRQKSAHDLAGAVDVMFVVGGYHSANTRRLAEVCKAINPRTYHIETAKEIEDLHTDNATVAGVTAGASTPDWVVKEVCNILEQK